jgi:chromosome segregation ATPase
LVRQYSGAPQADGIRASAGGSSGSHQWMTDGAKGRADGSLFAMLGAAFDGSAQHVGEDASARDSTSSQIGGDDSALHTLAPYDGNLSQHGRSSSAVSEHARRAQIGDGGGTGVGGAGGAWAAGGGRDPTWVSSPADLREQLDKAQQVLQHERASKHKLEHDLETLRLENAELRQQVEEVEAREPASQLEQDETVLKLQDELRLMRTEQRQSNGRAIILLGERDDAREQLHRIQRSLQEKELEHQEEARDLQRRLDSETQRLAAESARLCAQLEQAMAAKQSSALGARESEASQEKEKEMMASELALLRQGIKDSSAALAASRQREADLSEAIARVRDEMQMAREGMEAVMKRDAAKELEVENLKRALAMVGDERDVLKSELHSQQLKQQSEMDDALQELHEASEEASRAKEELAQVCATRDRLSSQVAALTRSVDSLDSLKREAERDIEAKENEIVRLGQEVHVLQDQSKAAAEAARDELALTLDSLSKARQQLAACEKEILDLHVASGSKVAELSRGMFFCRVGRVVCV